MSLCTLFTPGCQTFRDERQFLFKNHAPVSLIQIKNNNNLIPVITIIGVPFIVIKFEVSRVFKQRRFGAFFFLICLDTTKFVLRSVFTLKETICPKICSKSRLKSAKSPLPVDVRRSKTS